ncbi:histone-lysine N-methyltransferase SMYD3 isoform X3 [Hyperolius riggenbachi]|uniref:histone-lysine N-methyltransferase SMYD3 isoform X3 n=1 Tax=Hyperolius riggenbachi TaxID=752182 RepID=UPI0035A3464B
MAGNCEIFQSPGKGNGLRATRDLTVSEMVISTEPFVYTACHGKTRGATCHYCLRRSKKLQRCSQCKFAQYCNSVCQRNAWKDHKRECRCLKSVYPNIPTDSVRLISRIIFKLLENPACSSGELYSIHDLQSHVQELREEMKEGLGHLAATLEQYLKTEIQDSTQLPPGFHIFEYFSKMTISYIDVKMPTHQRQAQLNRQYCFSCDCHRCLTKDKDEDMLAGDIEISKEVECSIKTLEELHSQNKGGEVLTLCRKLINDSGLPDKNIYLLKVLDLAMDSCINSEMWEEALKFGLQTLEPYSLYYSSYHPVRAIQMMKVGKLQLHMGLFSQAMDTLKQAFEIMKVSHGRNHSMTRDLTELLRDCEMGLRTA